MEAGNIVEEGRHADLITIENGVYARFYKLQSAPQSETLIG
jgi:ATP-binding cassette subfamily B protein